MKISNLFEPPSGSTSGLTNTFLAIGSVVSVDTNLLEAQVLTNQGLLENVRLSFPYMSKGSGIFCIPNSGDMVAVSFTLQGDPYIVGSYSLDPEKELEEFQRLNIPSNTIMLTINKRSLLVVSDDIHLTTSNGNHILLNNDNKNPEITLESSKKITLRTGPTPDASTIEIITENNETLLNVSTKGGKKCPLKLTFKEGNVSIEADKITYRVPGADATNLVTAKQVLDVIIRAITSHTHASVGDGGVLPPPPLSLSGILGLHTEKKE